MEQRDFLKRQIDQIGRILGKMLSDMIGLKGSGQSGEGLTLAWQALKNELDIDLQKLIDTPLDDFIDTLKAKEAFNNENLEKLADVLLAIANDSTGRNRKALFERSLVIYEYLEVEENSYSFPRQQKIEQIKKQLQFKKNK